MEKMKVCIAGNSGHALSVFDSPEATEQIEITGYCSSYQEENLGALKDAFREHELQVPFYTDYEQMLTEAKPEIVVIDSMFCDHAAMALAALKRGIHVFCEKPLATEIKDFEALTEEAEKSGAKIFAMQSLRYISWFYTAKKLVDEGHIGKVRMINVQKCYKLGKRAEFFKHRETYGGTIPWVAIHGIDLILWVAGEKVSGLQAFQSSADNFGNGDLEMTAVCSYSLKGDIVANLQADYYRTATAPCHSDDRLRIVGTKGVVEVRANKVYLTNEENYEQEQELKDAPDMFMDFLAYVKGSTESLIDTKGSLYTTEIALLTRESAETGTMKQIQE